MILHNLKVTNWRSLLGEHAFGPFSEQLNVIHAPNGSGKSSLFEALRRALFDAHTVGGAEIAEIEPWGRDLAPAVEVEFSTGGERYLVRKKFISQQSAELQRMEDGKFQPLAEGRDADARIRTILAAPDQPGRGLSQDKHWGLAQVLWAPQGQLDLGELSGSVTQALRQALGVQVSTAGSSRLEKLLRERFLEFYTDKGKLRSGKNGAPLLELQEERSRLVAELAECRAHQQEYEEAVRTVEDARSTREQVRRSSGELEKEIARAREQQAEYRRLKQDLQVAEQKEQLARLELDRWDTRIRELGELRERLAHLQTEDTERGSRLEQARADRQSAEIRLTECRAARDTARRSREDLDSLREEAEEARRFVEARSRREMLDGQLAEIAKLEKRLADAREEQARHHAPEPGLIRDLRKLLRKQDDARRSLDCALVHLRITPEHAVRVRKPDGEWAELPAGREQAFSDSPEVAVEIEGLGRVIAAGPEVDAAEHRRVLEKTERDIARLTEPFDEWDPDKLQDRLDAANAARASVKSAQQVLDSVLQGREAEDLRAERGRLDSVIGRLEEKHADWRETPPSADALSEKLARRQKDLAKVLDQAEEDFDKAQNRLNALEQQVARLEEESRGCARQISEGKSRLAQLLQDDPSEDDPARESRRQEARKAWNEAREQSAFCRDQLEKLPEDIERTVATLEKQEQAARTAEDQARNTENQAEGRLAVLAERGVYSRLVEVEEQLMALDARIAREELRMNALRLLHETVDKARSRMVEAVAGPVEKSAGRLLQRIAGPRLGHLRLDENFVPMGVRPEVAGDEADPVGLLNLSGGEREQLQLAVRLALGQVLAGGERQLLVLDDVLNATDAGRFARVLNVLEEAAEHLQIVVLTCHPERYGALGGAEMIPLRGE